MTRAKEQLILLCTEQKPEERLQTLAARLNPLQLRLDALQVQAAGSFADWLLCTALRHPDAHVLREIAGLSAEFALPAQERMTFRMERLAGADEAAEESTQSCAPAPQENAALLREEVRSRMRWQYPYASLCRLAAKRAVSELTEQVQQEAFAFSSRPAFARAQNITAAQRGTAMHAFLQYADYARAAASLSDELARLERLGYLASRDIAALERDKLMRFLGSDFATRMLASKRLLREKKFTLRIPAEEFAREDPLLSLSAAQLQGETVVVQGIIDCAFEENGALVLLDYKTDRVEAMELLQERYAAQLGLYRRAMEECFGMPVAETLLYSFWLGDWVRV
jgi:ATP-dependent helicase/nuclease subunit A